MVSPACSSQCGAQSLPNPNASCQVPIGISSSKTAAEMLDANVIPRIVLCFFCFGLSLSCPPCCVTCAVDAWCGACNGRYHCNIDHNGSVCMELIYAGLAFFCFFPSLSLSLAHFVWHVCSTCQPRFGHGPRASTVECAKPRPRGPRLKFECRKYFFHFLILGPRGL